MSGKGKWGDKLGSRGRCRVTQGRHLGDQTRKESSLKIKKAETTTEEGHKVFSSGKEDKHEHGVGFLVHEDIVNTCLLYTSPSPRDEAASRMPSSA